MRSDVILQALTERPVMTRIQLEGVAEANGWSAIELYNAIEYLLERELITEEVTRGVARYERVGRSYCPLDVLWLAKDMTAGDHRPHRQLVINNSIVTAIRELCGLDWIEIAEITSLSRNRPSRPLRIDRALVERIKKCCKEKSNSRF